MIPKNNRESPETDMDLMVHQEVRRLVLQADSPYLPSIREMAKILGIRAARVQSVITHLQKEGLIAVKPRGRIQILDKKASMEVPEEKSAAARLADTIKTWIHEGKLAAGASLPKRQFMKNLWRVSDRTIKCLSNFTEAGFCLQGGQKLGGGLKTPIHQR